jgi:phage shock protein A
MITKRIVNVWRAVVGASLTNLEANHAEEMLGLEREELQKQIYQFNRGLAGHAGLCERLKSEITRLEKERTALEPKLRARLATGDRIGAGRQAMRLEAIASEHAQHTSQLVEAEATYKELVRAREVALVAAKEKIEGLKRSIGDYKVQQALADLTELAAGMHGSIGLTDGTLDRVKERVDEKRNFAAGRARVARDAIDTSGVRLREAEQEAMAEDALRRFEVIGAPSTDGLPHVTANAGRAESPVSETNPVTTANAAPFVAALERAGFAVNQ